MAMLIDAPFPKNKRYHERTEKAFGNSEGSERNFAARMGSSAIPEDYLDEFQRTLDELVKWAEDRRVDREKVDDMNFFESAPLINWKADTHIMLIKVAIHNNSDVSGKEINLNEIVIRPCAEGHGFYKILLYHLIQLAKHNPKVTEFRVVCCYPENEQILLHYGFTFDEQILIDNGIAKEEDYGPQYRDYFMRADQMREVTFESWNMGKLLLPEVTPGAVRVDPGALPTAEMLNSKAYVERYALDKDHQEALREMRAAGEEERGAKGSSREGAGKRKQLSDMDASLECILRQLESRLSRLEARGSTHVYSR